MNKNRRQFLEIMLATSAFGLAGCGSYHKPPITDAQLAIPPHPIYRAPNTGPDANLDLAFDAHVHLFNGSDIQAVGYFRGPVLEDTIDNRALRYFLRCLADILDPLLSFAPSAHKEMNILNAKLMNDDKALFNTLNVTGKATKALEIGETTQAEITKNQFRKNITNEVRKAFIDAVDEAYNMDSDGVGNKLASRQAMAPLDIFGDGFLDTVVDDYYAIDSENGIKALQQKNSDQLKSLIEISEVSQRQFGVNIAGIWTFLTAIMGYRYTSLKKYRATYTKLAGKNGFGINACFAAMLDFDHWLKGRSEPRTKLRDQILLMERLAIIFEGFMLPVVAYSPWPEEAAPGKSSLDMVKNAIFEKGFVGVKIYPSIGYKPSNNNLDQFHPRDKAPNSVKALNQNLDIFFKFCRDNDIPVMAHANNSLGEFSRKPGPDYRKFGGPEAWDEFFRNGDEIENKRKMQRINLGHVGLPDLDEAPNSYWLNRFFKNAANQKLVHQYGDLGFWTELFEPSKRDKLLSILKEITEMEILPSSPGASVVRGEDRLMFGSDWFMITQTVSWQSYAHDIYTVLSSEEGLSNQAVRKIFDTNIMTFYGFPAWRGAPTSNNYTRLKSFYRSAGIKPYWLDRAENRSKADALG